MAKNDRNEVLGGDERIRSESVAASRGSRELEGAEREFDGTAFTSEERRRLFRDEWTQEALPSVPSDAPKGFHYCWLSTTNSADPIYKRLRMGYSLVKAAEIPGFMHLKAKEGEYADCISCNEMILAKIPNDLYEEVMMYFHEEMPNQEEDMLRQNLPSSERDSSGRELVSREGFEPSRRPHQRPSFG